MNTLEGMIKDLNKSELVADDGETDICTTSGELITALKRLQHYEDLEEQGKLVILQKPIGRVTFDQFNDEGGTHDTSTND